MASPEINTILYATDFSESSVPACDHALLLSRLSGAKLHILHVISEMTDQQRSQIHPDLFDQFAKGIEQQTDKDMQDFCTAHFEGVTNLECHMVAGNPFKEIIAQAEKLNADMIVMGTHGRTGIEHVLVGSTAERVVRNSTIPVLTVRTR